MQGHSSLRYRRVHTSLRRPCDSQSCDRVRQLRYGDTVMPPPDKPKIVSIRVHSILDENPDLSFYGEYGNSCTANNCIDRQARGDRHSNYEYRYFNPATEYGELDYERMED